MDVHLERGLRRRPGRPGHPDALGRAVHITADESLTWNHAFRTVAATLGAGEPDLVHVLSDTLAALRPDLQALLGDKASSIVFDNTRVKSLVPAFDAQHLATVWRAPGLQAHAEARQPDSATTSSRARALLGLKPSRRLVGPTGAVLRTPRPPGTGAASSVASDSRSATGSVTGSACAAASRAAACGVGARRAVFALLDLLRLRDGLLYRALRGGLLGALGRGDLLEHVDLPGR